jgi:hypothetical protein
LTTDSMNLSRNLVFRLIKEGILLLSFSSHIEN